MFPLKYTFLSFTLLLHASSGDECYPNAVELNFHNAEVTVNNLAGQGPNDSTDAEQIRYSNVGTFDGASFDMIVEIQSGTGYTPANSAKNGLNGNFGNINVMVGTAADVVFTFKDSTTDEDVTLPYFFFSFFDLDQGPSCQENLCIHDGEFESMEVIENNEENIVTTSDHSCHGVAGISSTTISTTDIARGFGCDNPSDPTRLGIVTCDECSSCVVDGKNSEWFPINQMNRSVSFTFKDTHKFEFVFDVLLTSGVAVTSGRNLLFAGTSSLSPCQPTLQPTIQPTVAPPTSTNGGRGGHTCFSAHDKVQLESGEMRYFRDVKVGDRILSANREGEITYSNLVFLPHGENDKRTTFLEIKTENGKSIKMTRAHLLPTCDGALSIAANLQTETCIRTNDGDDKVISIKTVELNGVYTAVTENEFLVVNGIIASPFAASSGLVHAYYNLTDMEDWCASNEWLAFDSARHPHVQEFNAANSDGGKPPSQDCLAMLQEMFENYKDEPIGWGEDGFGYKRHWSNPSEPNVHDKVEKTAPLILSGWTWDE